MTSDDLTPEQLAALRQQVSEHLGYLVRLDRRMKELRFPRDDPLGAATERAKQATADLYVLLHQWDRRHVGPPRTGA